MKIKGGANLVERQPAFSADGKLLLVCTGSTVSVYSVATGLLVNQLEGHNAPVTSINVVHYPGAAKSSVNHVWTSSMDGSIRFWNFSSGSLIKTVSIGKPIISMVVPGLSTPETGSPSKPCIAFLLVPQEEVVLDATVDIEMKEKNGKMNGKKKHSHKILSKKLQNVDGKDLHVILHNLTNGKRLHGQLAKVSAPQTLVCSRLGGLVGIVDRRKILVWKIPQKHLTDANSLKVTHLHHTKKLQALAFDPTETVVAGSDDWGRILLWKNVGEHSFNLAAHVQEEGREHDVKHKRQLDMNSGVRGHDDAEALTTYHWHSDEVNFLTFSMDGAYLFSGGKEAVFVMWQLETGKKQFLPRLGSSLLYCASSSDASVFSISCADNTIKLVNIGTMAVQKTIQGIKPPVSLLERETPFYLTRVAIQPGPGSLVLAAEDMSLQFYDPFYDRQIGEVEISPRNYISSLKEGSEKAGMSGPVVFVTHVVFSRDGSAMATAECHLAEEGIGGGSCIKFWKQTSSKADFCLNTRIDDPHSIEVSCLVYHPFLNMAVSCCKAGEFKVWIQSDAERENQNVPNILSWRCRSVGSYQQKPMYCASFSPDGTLLAVAAEELITLWNPASNGLVHILASNSLMPVKLLSFVPMTHHLISASWGEHPQLTVWSLETLSICWSYDIEVKALAVDFHQRHFAILAPSCQTPNRSKANKRTGQAVIAVFNVHTPFPDALWSAQDVEGSTLFCVPPSMALPDNADTEEQSSSKMHLIFMSHRGEYVMFNPFIAQDDSEATSKRFNTLNKQGPSAFEVVFGKASTPQADIQTDISKVKAVQPWGNLLNCPSHLISLTSIGFSYIESLLEKRTDDS